VAFKALEIGLDVVVWKGDTKEKHEEHNNIKVQT
jgi:hypothetical protein